MRLLTMNNDRFSLNNINRCVRHRLLQSMLKVKDDSCCSAAGPAAATPLATNSGIFAVRSVSGPTLTLSAQLTKKDMKLKTL